MQTVKYSTCTVLTILHIQHQCTPLMYKIYTQNMYTCNRLLYCTVLHYTVHSSMIFHVQFTESTVLYNQAVQLMLKLCVIHQFFSVDSHLMRVAVQICSGSTSWSQNRSLHIFLHKSPMGEEERKKFCQLFCCGKGGRHGPYHGTHHIYLDTERKSVSRVL